MIRKLSAAFAASVCAIAITACSNQAPQTSLVGMNADDFQLTDQDGVAQILKYDKVSKAVVLVSQANGDKNSQAAGKALLALQEKYPDVRFMMVNSSPTDTRETIAEEAKAQGYTFPVLDDDVQLIGQNLVWSKAPESSLLDHHGFSYVGEAMVIDP
ncbi:MAG: hypothetical protein R3C52_10370, partial [Hyphomonadaceae bacterium]